MITLSTYNEKGEVAAQAVDMNRNGTIDYSGTDRITEYLNSVTTKSGLVVRKNTTRIYQQNNSATPVDASVAEYSTNGRHSWNSNFGQNSYSATVLNGNGSKTVTVNNPDGSTIVSAYQDGRIISSTHSVLGTSNYEYDGFGRIAAVRRQENGILRSTVYSYDGDGRILALTEQPSGKITSYTYDSMGRRTSAVLPGGRNIYYEYYPTGELKKIHGADTYTQAYAYDAQGRMSTLTTYKDASTPQVTSWIYNNRGFMTSKNYADGNGVTYDYNADGQLILRIWARGVTTTYAYDHAGRQTGIDYSDSTPDIGYTYDWMGNPATVTDATGTHVFTYDYATAGHPGLASATVPYILNHSVAYAYDALGRRISMSLMNGATPALNNAYTYDVQNRLASVGNGTHAAHYTRLDGNGLLSNTAIKTSGGTTLLSTDRAYDAYYRMTSIASTASSTTRSYAYTYNDKDQRTICTLADGSYWEYAYDDKGQVIGGVKYDAGGIAIPIT